MSPRPEWTEAEIETLADLAYQKRLLRCPSCTGPVKSRSLGVMGRTTTPLMLYCERCRAQGQYSPDHLEAMELEWSREEKIQLVERYWGKRGYLRCPNDDAVLTSQESKTMGPGPTQVHFLCPHCGRHFWSKEVDNLEDPDSFEARYETLSTLGQGGMGTVELVSHRETGKHFAAKRIRPDFLKSDEAVKRFRREERILRKLRHPHIVPIQESFIDEDGGVLIMGHMAGGTLADAIRSPDVSPETLRAHFRDLVAGLEFLHAEGIIHRDLKPDNVLIDGKRRARISDFGLAKLVERDTTTLTARGTFLGTTIYAAPEQQRDTAEATKRCDIYALGLIAYEIARRESPYLTPINNDGFGEAFCDALRDALARDPSQRIITPKDLANALDEEIALHNATTAVDLPS